MLGSLLFLSLGLSGPTLSTPVQSQAEWTVYCNQPTIKVSPDLFGIFFEEINCAGDGGLYAELVRNRSFEDAPRPDHWSAPAGGTISLDSAQPATSFNQKSLKVEVNVPGSAGYPVSNEGYWGMGIERGKSYRLSFRCRAASPMPQGLTLNLESSTGAVLATSKVSPKIGGWNEYKATLRATKSDPKAKLVLRARDKGTYWLDMVSLFPSDTFKGRANGMRPDLAKKLNDLKPSFLRFPGGCWVEGDTMALSQRWKQTVGAQIERRTQPNIWRYMSTNGMGYHEYLQLCEDLGAAPMFVINCGMSHKEVVPMDKMDEYVQDALDAIEYANGPVTSKWGALRAKNGHPKPFNLKYLEIGNENGGPAYEERYGLIWRAVKKKYPNIITIANLWGGTPKKTPIEVLDEHYYYAPTFFIQNADRYDTYDRKGPKIYVGEYAVTQGCGQGNLIAALGEAAFMTGMERNSDIVVMASYAPLFANVNLKAWNPDLICFDSSRSYGIPSYYIQKMFSQNRPTRMVKTDLKRPEPFREKFPTGGVGVGTWSTQSEYKDIKVTQGDKVLFESKDGSELKPQTGDWKVVDGALRQTGSGNGTRAYFGDSTWHNYTLTLKARKISGAEGFLISVAHRDQDNYIWWNIGGWNNTQGALELGVKGDKTLIGRQVDSKVETGRWYDLKMEFTDERIKCWQDGKLIYDQAVPTTQTFHASAGIDEKTGETILKVVNAGSRPVSANVALKGMHNARITDAEVLTSGDPMDENTLDNPNKVSPKKVQVKVAGDQIQHLFPAYSFTLIRLKGTK